MIKQIFLWCIGRLEATTRENQRKIALGQRAAHAMMFYLHGLPISTIDATGETQDICLMRSPMDVDELMQFTRPLLLARAAERAMLVTADELLHGRRFLSVRMPDRSLIGFCDGNGNILATNAEIVAHMMKVTDNIMAMEDVPVELQDTYAAAADYQAFLFDTLAERMIAHYYMAIVHLGVALVKQPVVTGVETCRVLLQDCLRRGRVNSLPVYCACHTDPMKSAMEKAVADRLRSLREQQ